MSQLLRLLATLQLCLLSACSSSSCRWASQSTRIPRESTFSTSQRTAVNVLPAPVGITSKPWKRPVVPDSESSAESFSHASS